MKLIVANWKMNMDYKLVNEWINQWNELTQTPFEYQNIIPVVTPSYLHLDLANTIENIMIGAQDVSNKNMGAHTGEIGAELLADYCDYVIVGHSERNESIDLRVQKTIKCIESKMTPIICFTNIDQLKAILEAMNGILSDTELSDLVFAWEDPKNISSDGIYKPKDPKEIAKHTKEIRNILQDMGQLLYGGSVNKENVEKLLEIKEIEGFLIGHASCEAKHFYGICELASKK